jgi:hypothetical protein
LVPGDRGIHCYGTTGARPGDYRARTVSSLRTSRASSRSLDVSPYIRGLAYLAQKNGTAAVAEFQKLLNHRGVVVNFVTGTLAHLQIGRAYAMAGDTAKAKAAYKDFLILWKDADPDIPILKQAKAEYAKLQ